MTTNSIYSLLKKHKIHPKKRLGQHFLHATPTIKKIVDSMEIGKDDHVIEIGPGPGIMTGHIAKKAKNKELVKRLSKQFHKGWRAALPLSAQVKAMGKER